MSPRKRRRAGGAAVPALAALTSPIRAVAVDDLTARLAWDPPPGEDCVDLRAVERTVEERLGRKVFNSSAPSLSIVGRFASAGDRKTVALEVVTPSAERLGERELSASSCEELRASLPVVIAVLLDFAFQERAQGPAPVAPDARRGSAEAGTEKVKRHRVEVSALAELLVGLQPGIAGGMAVEASVSVVGPLAIAVWGDLRLPSSTDGPESLTLQTGTIGGGVCAGAFVAGRLGLRGCAGAGALFLGARGDRFERSYEDSRWVPEARAFADLAYPLFGSVFARAGGGVTIPLERPRYGYDDQMTRRVELFQPSWGGLGMIGVSVLLR